MTVTQAMGKQAAVVKPVQVLSLNPSTNLTFRGDFREVINADLSLTNSTNRRVVFKVKTNYPHRYFVRPNGGLIEPTEQQTVTIMLQPLEYNNEEMKLHKFMVQSIFAPEGPINGLEKLWKDAKPDEIMDTKIRCLFERLTPSPTEEVPRYRGKELDGNGTSTKSVLSSSGKDVKTTGADGGNTATIVIFVIFLIICLIVFGYVKSKQA
jgi:hypothetical protein